MKSIQAYKTTDGKVFEDMLKGKEHQNNLDLAKDLDLFLDKKDTRMGFDDQFIEFVVENRERLLDILKTNS